VEDEAFTAGGGSQLCELDLSSTAVSDPGLQALLLRSTAADSSGGCAGSSGNAAGGSGGGGVGGATGRSTLRRLALAGCDISVVSIPLFADLHLLSSLDLSMCPGIKWGDLRQIIDGGLGPRLVELGISGINEPWLYHVARACPVLEKLTAANCNDVTLHDDASGEAGASVSALMASAARAAGRAAAVPLFQRLRTLDLSDSTFDAQLAAPLLNCCRGLGWLDLSGTDATDSTVAALASIRTLAWLGLRRCNHVTAEGADQLLQNRRLLPPDGGPPSPPMTVDVSHCKHVTARGVAALRRQYPVVSFEWC
jgi:hypothetical protein